VPIGFSLLDASRAAHIPHASICGGRARCSTCRVRIIDGTERIPPPSAGEWAVLQSCGAGPAVRLACQSRPEGDIRLVPLLPPAVNAAQLRAGQLPQPGKERFIVVLVADMRDSTRLATTRLPFDAVFIIDRFLSAIGSAVSEAGGRPNQFTGDGLIAMFGLGCDPAEAARQAVSAIGRIGRNVATLNQGLLAEGSDPVRFGIGVHGSPAVVGEIGYGHSRVFTTLGDAAIVATRLESLCKQFGCEAVVSEAVCNLSGQDLSWLPLESASIRGMDSPLPARLVRQAEALATVIGTFPLPGVAAG
jgi:adenylate cyclase